jgi:hypothetical protein
MKSGRSLSLLFGFTLLFLVLAGATGLHRHGVWQMFSKTEVLVGIRPERGFAYFAPTHHGELSGRSRPSEGRMWENGVLLPGPADAIHEDIRELGKGRFSFF